MSCCRAASSMIALYFKRSQRKMSYHPCPGEVSRNDARHIDGRWRRGVPTITRQLKFKEQKLSGGEKVQPRNLFVLSQPRLTSCNNPNNTMNNNVPRREIKVYHASVAVSTLFVEDSASSQRRSLSQSNEKYSLNTLEAISDSIL